MRITFTVEEARNHLAELAKQMAKVGDKTGVLMNSSVLGSEDVEFVFEFSVSSGTDFDKLKDIIKTRFVAADGSIPNKIEAIKMVRTLTSAGLKEAKDYVDNLVAGSMYPEKYFALGTVVNFSSLPTYNY
jgi:ribosomal protein L7/L12